MLYVSFLLILFNYMSSIGAMERMTQVSKVHQSSHSFMRKKVYKENFTTETKIIKHFFPRVTGKICANNFFVIKIFT